MRRFDISNYLEDQRKNFKFLIDNYNYQLVESERDTFGFISIYKKNGFRIYLNYDIRDNCFYFDFVKGEETNYPNDNDNINILPFFKFFEIYEKNLDFMKLIPNDKQYLEALKLNAELLKKYGDKILKGEEWPLDK